MRSHGTDTNPIAHRLLDTFGSLSAVFEASTAELMERADSAKMPQR